MDLARLGISIETRDARRAERDLGGFERQARSTEQAALRLSRGTNRLNQRLSVTQRAASGMGHEVGAASRATRGLGAALRPTALQLSQVAQQASATGRPLQALAIQLPDIGLAFGTVGIAAGVAAGAILSFISTTGRAVTGVSGIVEEFTSLSGGLESVRSQITTLTELQNSYTNAIAASQGASGALATAVAANSMREFEARRQVLGVELQLLRIRRGEMATDLRNLQDQQNLLIGRRMQDLVTYQSVDGPFARPDFHPPNLGLGTDVLGSAVDQRMVLAIRRLRAELALTDLAIDEVDTAFSNAFEDVEGGAGTAGGALRRLSNTMDQATTFAEGFTDSLESATRSAVDMGREFGSTVVRGVDGLANAFAEFTVRGFRDFQSFTTSVLEAFKQMLVSMIAMAARNRILIGLGFGGGTAAQAVAGPGLVGNLAAGQGLLGAFGGGGSIFGFGGLGGGTGLLGGLGNALSGGLGNVFSVTANAAAAGSGFLATVGAALPVLGAVGLAFGLFRTRTRQLDQGLQVTISNTEALVQGFRTIEKSRFFGLSKRVSTELTSVDAVTQASISNAVAAVQGGVFEAAGALGFAADTFDGFSHTMRVSLQGLGEEARQSAIENALTGVADAMARMVPGLTAFSQGGETASATLDRLSSSLSTVNLWMGNLGLQAYELSLAGADMSSAFAALFGGLEEFTGAANAYYQDFYTEAERTRRATDLLTMELNALGIDTLPTTRAAFRALVDEADALGQSELTASLIQLAPAFAEITGEVNALTDALSGQGLYRTLADQVFANTAAGYQAPIDQVLAADNAELKALLREVVKAIREGDLNNARIQSKILAIQERTDLEPTP